MHRPPLPPRNIPGTHFCYWLSRSQSHSAGGRILCQCKIPMTPSGIEPATFRPQPTAPPRTPEISSVLYKNFTTFWAVTRRVSPVPSQHLIPAQHNTQPPIIYMTMYVPHSAVLIFWWSLGEFIVDGAKLTKFAQALQHYYVYIVVN